MLYRHSALVLADVSLVRTVVIQGSKEGPAGIGAFRIHFGVSSSESGAGHTTYCRQHYACAFSFFYKQHEELQCVVACTTVQKRRQSQVGKIFDFCCFVWAGGGGRGGGKTLLDGTICHLPARFK